MPDLQIREAQSIPGSEREGNGNPLQCSCLENPRDKGAWWAAVYGVSQSQTRLKRLSSSSSSKREKKPTSFIIKYKISKSARGEKKDSFRKRPRWLHKGVSSTKHSKNMHACMHTESLQSCPTLQAPLSMGFSRQDYWRGLPCLPPGDLSNPGIKPLSLMSPALAGRFFLPLAPAGKPE